MNNLGKTVLKIIVLLAVYSFLCFPGYWAIDKSLGSSFWFTGWDPRGNFSWSSDIYWVPLFIIITLLAVTVLAWTLHLIRDQTAWRTWIKILSILALFRLIFALTTWDSRLLWRWLYGNPYEIWLPDRLNTLAGYTLIETILFALALLVYLRDSTVKNSKPLRQLL